MEEFHGELLGFLRWQWSKSTSKLPFVWNKASIGLIKGLIGEEQFLLNQHNLSHFWIIYINPHFVPPKKWFLHPLHPLQKNFGGSNRLPVIPTRSLQHLGSGHWRSGRWAPPRWVAKRRVRSHSSGGSQGPNPDAHRCGDGLGGHLMGRAGGGTFNK